MSLASILGLNTRKLNTVIAKAEALMAELEPVIVHLQESGCLYVSPLEKRLPSSSLKVRRRVCGPASV